MTPVTDPDLAVALDVLQERYSPVRPYAYNWSVRPRRKSESPGVLLDGVPVETNGRMTARLSRWTPDGAQECRIELPWELPGHAVDQFVAAMIDGLVAEAFAKMDAVFLLGDRFVLP